MNYTHQSETTLVIQPLRKDFFIFRIRSAFLFMISLFCLIVLPHIVQAGDITGTVVDANTDSFIPGASVRLTELGRTTTTDRSGEFRFANVAGGSYTLSVRFIGYDTVSESVQVPASESIYIRIPIGGEIVELEDFTVEGYREGRSKALQQKKTSPTLRDIISADSIGNLPDQNVAEALVRVPGVSIELAQGEGRFVSIRGIAPELNNVTVNGANIANPSVGGRAGRSVPLDVVGSSSVSQLEVIKAVTPDMDAQGLGGTVNIITPSGFDSEKGFFNGSFEVGTNTLADDPSYRFNATYGNTFGPEKKLAIAVSASWEDRNFQTEAIDIRFRDDVDADINGDGTFDSKLTLPWAVEIVPQIGTRRRIGFNTKIEYRPDDTTEFSFKGIYNEFVEWSDKVEDIFQLDNLEYTFVSPTLAFAPNSEIRQRRFQTRTNQTLLNLTFAGKKTWGNLTINGEFTYSYQKEDDIRNNNIQFRARDRDGQMRLRAGETLSEINGVAIPITLCDNGVCSEGNSIPVLIDRSTPETKLSSGFADHDPTRFPHWRNQVNDSLSEENTYVPRIDVTWNTDNFLGTGNSGFLKFGFKYLNRKRIVDDTDVRTNSADATIATINDAFPGSFDSGRQVLSYNTDLELVFDPIFHGFFAGDPDGTGADSCCDEEASKENSVEDDYVIDEKIIGTYFMASVDIGEDLNILSGVRYERTDGRYQAFQFTRGRGSAPTLLNITEIVGTRVYNNWNPNLQIRYEINDNTIFRASFTSTLGRPDFEDAAPISRLRWDEDLGGATVTGELRIRNPQLQPYEALNFDASIDYYLKNGGLLSMAFFHKEIDNPIYETSGTERNITVGDAIRIIEAQGGAAFNPDGLELDEVFSEIEWESFQNADHGTITGVEVTAMIPFTFLPAPLDAFGMDSNVSFIKSSVDVIGRLDEDIPFFNQPDFIANVALWYQKGRISGRVAYRFQGSDIDGLESGNTVDFWNAERFQWDAQLSYRFNDHWIMFANFQNFTNETDDTIHGDVKFNLNTREKFGATYRLGLSWNY